MAVEVLFILVVCAIVAVSVMDVMSNKIQISKMACALLLIALGCVFILTAVKIWITIAFITLKVGSKTIIGIYTEEFVKIISSLSIGTAGIAIITGGFSLIAGGKYEVTVSSTEPIKGIKFEK